MSSHTAASTKLPEAGLTGSGKLKAVTELMRLLTVDVDEPTLRTEERDEALERLKVYGRDPTNADPIFTPKGIETLVKHAFSSSSPTTGRNALRVLCNAMLLRPETRQAFVDLGCEDKLMQTLRNDNWDDEFLASRVLFLTTYNPNANLEAVIEKHGLAEIVCNHLARHIQCTEKNPMEQMALIETGKLMFNFTTMCPKKVNEFSPAVPHLVALLKKEELSEAKPLDPPFGTIVNALLNLDFTGEEAKAAFFPTEDATEVTARLIKSLSLALKAYPDQELEATVPQLINILRKIHDIAPDPAKDHIRKDLLPTEEDRNDVLGKSDSTTARLLKNSANPMTPNLREATRQLLWELSDQDSDKFTHNVGFGFASGLLFDKNLPMPASAAGTSDDAPQRPGGSSQSAQARPINPVTGQFLDREKEVDVPEMTEDEKLREAERLFVLFERLKQNGLISVENPLRTAVESGRIEELPDDSDAD